MLDDSMRLAGEDFEIVRGNESRLLKGIKQYKKASNRRYVQFYPGTDIQVGDLIRRKLSGDEWLAVEIDPHVISGSVFSVNAYYETKQEQQKQIPTSVNYNFHSSSNIIAGSQTNAVMNINIGEIETEIKKHGGADKEELLEMMEAIKQTFEQQSALPKNSLARFSDALERHSWITSSLVQLIGSASIQFLMSK